MCDECGVKLRPREWEVLELRYLYQLQQREICEKIALSERAVITHFNRIYRTIGVGGPEVPKEKKQQIAEVYYWWHKYREDPNLRNEKEKHAVEIEQLWHDYRRNGLPGDGVRLKPYQTILGIPWPQFLVGFAGLLVLGVVWYFLPRQPDPITIQPEYFKIQSVDGVDEFFLDLPVCAATNISRK